MPLGSSLSWVLLLGAAWALMAPPPQRETPPLRRAAARACGDPAGPYGLAAPTLLRNAGNVYRETSASLDLLTHHYTAPPDNPPPPGDCFNVLLVGGPGAAAPRISSFTSGAGPDQSVVLTGERFTARTGPFENSDTRVWSFSQTSPDDGDLREMSMPRQSAAGLTFTLDAARPYAMHLVWAENRDGLSLPVRINATQAWWLGPEHAQPGQTVAVYGRNLSRNNGETESFVYLRPWGAGAGALSEPAAVTAVNPYKVSFTVPSGLARGADYEVWIHNGHGGQYGWSGPLRLSVPARDPLSWPGPAVDIRSFGAIPDDNRDDSAAIQAACNAVTPGGTVFIPAGGFIVERQITCAKPFSLEGTGDHSHVLGVPGNGFEGIFKITGFPARVRRLRLASTIDRRIYSLGGILFFDGAGQAATPSGVVVENTRFELAPGLAHTAIGIRAVNDVRIARNSFTASMGVTAERSFQVFVAGNDFYGNRLDGAANPGQDHSAVAVTSSRQVDVSGNSASGQDPDRGRVLPRFFVAQGHSHGVSGELYIAANVTRNVGCADGDCGEQIFLEGAGAFTTASPLSVEGAQVRFRDVNWRTDYFAEDDPARYEAYNDRRPSLLMVQRGRGVGQYRRVLANSVDGAVIDRPWDIPPDASSSLTFLTAIFRAAIYRNDLSGFESGLRNPFGTNLGAGSYGAAVDVDIVGNKVRTVQRGIEISTLVNDSCGENVRGNALGNRASDCPNWSVLVAGNEVAGASRYGIGLLTRIEPPERAAGTPLLDNIVRGNRVSHSAVGLAVGDINRFPRPEPWQQGSVVEFNTVEESPLGADLMGLHEGTLLRHNRFAAGQALRIHPWCRDPRFYANSYEPGAAVYGGTTPDASLTALRRIVTLATHVREAEVELRNTGAKPVSLQVASSAEWVSAEPASELLEPEGAVVLRVRLADPLPAAEELATITIRGDHGGPPVTLTVRFLAPPE